MKKLTPIQVLYKKQVKRIQNLIRKYTKKGYMINFELPTLKRPNRRSIERLSKIKVSDILEDAYYTTPEGYRVNAYEALYEQRRESRRKAVKTRRLKEAMKKFDDLITVDIIEAIKERLTDIAGRGAWALAKGTGAVPYDFYGKVYPLISLMDDAEGILGTEEYNEYLRQNEFEIIKELDAIREEKYDEQLNASFAHLAVLLAARELSRQDMADISGLSDLFNDYDDIIEE